MSSVAVKLHEECNKYLKYTKQNGFTSLNLLRFVEKVKYLTNFSEDIKTKDSNFIELTYLRDEYKSINYAKALDEIHNLQRLVNEESSVFSDYEKQAVKSINLLLRAFIIKGMMNPQFRELFNFEAMFNL